MLEKKEKVLKVKKWTESVKNSNEKRIIKHLKSLLPKYKKIKWDELKFLNFYIGILNDLPSRYKQKNSIELHGRLKDEIIIGAIEDKLETLSEASSTSMKEETLPEPPEQKIESIPESIEATIPQVESEQTKVVEEHKPIEEVKPVEENKPVEVSKPVEESKTTEEVKPKKVFKEIQGVTFF